MIPNYEMDDDQWNALVQDVADHFIDVTLSRGYQYYKQGRVVKLTIPSGRDIKAMVEGAELYHIGINLDSFTLSRCDCPVGRYCKHMFAALLKYADLHNRSVHTLVNAKTTALSKPPVKPAPYAKSYTQAKELAARQAAENAARLKEQALRLPVMSISEWHQWFESSTERFMQNSRNTQFVNDALASIYRLKPALTAELESFFKLHANLFVLSKLTIQPQDQSGYVYSYLAFHTHHAASDLQDSIKQFIINMIPMATERSNQHLAWQTLSYLRKTMLEETNDNHYFLAQYQNIWIYWLCPGVNNDNDSTYAEELQQLERTAEEARPPLSSFALKMAQAAMHLYQSNDPDTWALLESVNNTSNIAVDFLLHFLTYLAQEEQWERLTKGLAAIAPLLNLRRSGDIRPYSDYWDAAVRHLPESEQQMWDTLVSMLPHSRALYLEKLVARGKWERWMDYHLSLDSDPMDFRVTELAPIEKNAPELLLPFYHQAIERYVLMKNRDGYKIAVKLLKRLSKLYKKLKQEPRWELFLSSFVGRNSRLRALQEELRKGNLLS